MRAIVKNSFGDWIRPCYLLLLPVITYTCSVSGCTRRSSDTSDSSVDSEADRCTAEYKRGWVMYESSSGCLAAGCFTLLLNPVSHPRTDRSRPVQDDHTAMLTVTYPVRGDGSSTHTNLRCSVWNGVSPGAAALSYWFLARACKVTLRWTSDGPPHPNPLLTPAVPVIIPASQHRTVRRSWVRLWRWDRYWSALRSSALVTLCRTKRGTSPEDRHTTAPRRAIRSTALRPCSTLRRSGFKRTNIYTFPTRTAHRRLLW